MGSDDFPLTQEFVSIMLGASRPTVTVVAGALPESRLDRFSPRSCRYQKTGKARSGVVRMLPGRDESPQQCDREGTLVARLDGTHYRHEWSVSRTVDESDDEKSSKPNEARSRRRSPTPHASIRLPSVRAAA